MKKLTQNEWVIEQLKQGRKLTPLAALAEYGIMRLGARIYELRCIGHEIKSEIKPVKNRYGDMCHVAFYSLSA